MLAYVTKSIVGAVVVLLVMSFIVFGLQSIIPADPARAIAGPNAPPETVEAMTCAWTAAGNRMSNR